jgi:hypothetical protein
VHQAGDLRGLKKRSGADRLKRGVVFWNDGRDRVRAGSELQPTSDCSFHPAVWFTSRVCYAAYDLFSVIVLLTHFLHARESNGAAQARVIELENMRAHECVWYALACGNAHCFIQFPVQFYVKFQVPVPHCSQLQLAISKKLEGDDAHKGGNGHVMMAQLARKVSKVSDWWSRAVACSMFFAGLAQGVEAAVCAIRPRIARA